MTRNTARAILPRRLRVAHVALGLDVGGLEKLLVEFARHTDRERFELHLVSMTTRGPLAEDIENEGWPVSALAAAPGFRPRLVLELARWFRRRQIDVVHAHDEKPCIYGAPAARLAGVRCIVHTRHGPRPQLTRRQAVLVRLASRLTDHFVCVSQDAARLSIEQGVAADRVRTIWNGIDLERFAYAGPCSNGPIAAVARLVPEKGLDYLVRAAALAVRECTSLQVEIAGDGPCLPELKRLAARLGVSGRVRFLGPVGDVSGLLARASSFVLPSLSEGLSLTLLEAMARGLPVVATRVGGNCEVVVDGETGLLTPASDPAALAAAILRLRDPRVGVQMGRAGRCRAEKYFDVRRMVAAYESLYRAGQTSARGRICPVGLPCTLSS